MTRRIRVIVYEYESEYVALWDVARQQPDGIYHADRASMRIETVNQGSWIGALWKVWKESRKGA